MLVSHDDARRIDTLSRSQRERLVQMGRYPQPVRVTPGRIGFVREEIEAWVRVRIEARAHKTAA